MMGTDQKIELPKNGRVILGIAKVTFGEIVRDKLLYSTIVLAVFLLVISMLAAQLSFFRPERIVLDFGLSAINLSTLVMGTLLGAVTLIREYERRTVFVALSKPISRFQFVFGKFFGLVAVLALNWILLNLAFSGILYLSGGQFTWLVFEAVFLILMQSFVVVALSILFSTVSTISLSIMMTLGVYMIGVNISSMLLVSQKAESLILKRFLDVLAHLVPNFEQFNLSALVTYDLPVDDRHMAVAFSYALVSVVLFLFLAGVLIHKKES